MAATAMASATMPNNATRAAWMPDISPTTVSTKRPASPATAIRPPCTGRARTAAAAMRPKAFPNMIHRKTRGCSHPVRAVCWPMFWNNRSSKNRTEPRAARGHQPRTASAGFCHRRFVRKDAAGQNGKCTGQEYCQQDRRRARLPRRVQRGECSLDGGVHSDAQQKAHREGLSSRLEPAAKHRRSRWGRTIGTPAGQRRSTPGRPRAKAPTARPRGPRRGRRPPPPASRAAQEAAPRAGPGTLRETARGRTRRERRDWRRRTLEGRRRGWGTGPGATAGRRQRPRQSGRSLVGIACPTAGSCRSTEVRRSAFSPRAGVRGHSIH